MKAIALPALTRPYAIRSTQILHVCWHLKFANLFHAYLVQVGCKAHHPFKEQYAKSAHNKIHLKLQELGNRKNPPGSTVPSPNGNFCFVLGIPDLFHTKLACIHCPNLGSHYGLNEGLRSRNEYMHSQNSSIQGLSINCSPFAWAMS